MICGPGGCVAVDALVFPASLRHPPDRRSARLGGGRNDDHRSRQPPHSQATSAFGSVRRKAGGSLERPSKPHCWTPKTCPALRSAPLRLVRFGGSVNDRRLVRFGKTGVGHGYFAARGTRFLRDDVRARLGHLCWSEPESRGGGGRESNPPGTFVPPPILKTGRWFPAVGESSGSTDEVLSRNRRDLTHRGGPRGRPVHKPNRVRRLPPVTERTPARETRRRVLDRQCPAPGTV